VDLTPGIKDIAIKNVDNSFLTFRLNAPIREESELRPLVIEDL